MMRKKIYPEYSEWCEHIVNGVGSKSALLNTKQKKMLHSVAPKL